jgi:hypothetical protein
VVQAQTGNPLNIVTNVTTFNGVVNTLRPDLIGSLDAIGDRNQWFSNSVCNPWRRGVVHGEFGVRDSGRG